MSLWRANIDGLDLRWQSPIEGPFIRSGWPFRGWGPRMAGRFDELLVRCGLRSFGAPDFDKESGRLLFPLHGRIGNLPAEKVELELDAEHRYCTSKAVSVKAVSCNSTCNWMSPTPLQSVNRRSASTIKFAISVTPDYHATAVSHQRWPAATGRRIKFAFGAKRVVARNDHAAKDLESWQKYQGPTRAIRSRFISRAQQLTQMVGRQHC